MSELIVDDFTTTEKIQIEGYDACVTFHVKDEEINIRWEDWPVVRAFCDQLFAEYKLSEDTP